jgi:hypothetical protein
MALEHPRWGERERHVQEEPGDRDGDQQELHLPVRGLAAPHVCRHQRDRAHGEVHDDVVVVQEVDDGPLADHEALQAGFGEQTERLLPGHEASGVAQGLQLLGADRHPDVAIEEVERRDRRHLDDQ